MNTPRHKPIVLIAVFIVLFALLIFYRVFTPGNILFSTDDPLGNIVQGKSLLPHTFFAWWADSPLFGSAGGRISFSWTNLWMWLLPALVFKNWFHALNLAGASLFLAMFLRKRGISLPAQIMGILTAFWLGSNLTLVYASHILKYATMFLAMLALWCITRAIQERSFPWSMLAGSVLGLMMLEQQDVASFIGIFLAAFALYEFYRLEKLNLPVFIKLFAPMALCALLIAGPTILIVYTVNVGSKDKQQQDIAADKETSQQKWEFTTQWSWPPEECIDFIAPGYMGWRSGEPEGPYWGRMGRSAGWEQTRQGFMNFKLENHYIGVIPIVFALLAIFVALRRKESAQLPASGLNDETRIRSDIIFWTCATIIALLLSFGKYFPLYALFYQLPLVNSIRNPNKFLHVFQIGLGILAAYGLDVIIKNRLSPARQNCTLPAWK